MAEIPRGRFPEALPSPINHVVLTGALGGDPQIARSPAGDPVTLMRLEFRVADPAEPRMLWTPMASCMVEVPFDRAVRDLAGLCGGAQVLVSGQLSERWVIEGGHTSRRGVIVATLLKPGPPHTGRLELPL